MHCGGLTFAHPDDPRRTCRVNGPHMQQFLFDRVPVWVIEHGYAIEGDATYRTAHNCVDDPELKAFQARHMRLFGWAGREALH